MAAPHLLCYDLGLGCIQISQTGGQANSETFPYKVSEYSVVIFIHYSLKIKHLKTKKDFFRYFRVYSGMVSGAAYSGM